ncbi:Ig-like domain-containing protein [Methanofollis tationis]|uniref:VWFA domain-containing protein n=1 Tax=Methanofollis tationis TaxID=81417 RepID=A0A7K4HN22_9EURY|nr:Ig-like domain-containing protein [Methanofollis tationis]NVO66654.1 hypothetical protein [Methanofollis tationis]
MDIPIKNMFLIGFVLLALVTAASGLPTVSVSTDTAWLTAGGSETATVTVQVNDEASRIVSLSSTLGTLSPSIVTTDARGQATTTFTAGTVSGTATITAVFTDENGTPVSASVDLSIDHGTPIEISSLSCPEEGSVGSEVEIALALSDRWDNPVDNANIIENVTFSVGSPGDGAAFIIGDRNAASVSLPVGPDGLVTATLRLSTMAGENIVQITPPGAVGDRYLTILGVADGPPVSIESAYASASCPADGVGTVLIAYTLYDQYGNLCNEAPVRIASSLGEATAVTTNSYGSVLVRYGPKNAPVDVTLTATAAEDASVFTIDTFSFASTDPVNLVLAASPLNMKSLDVDPSSEAGLAAWVTDESGVTVTDNQVDVTFTITDIDGHGATLTADPCLNGGSSTVMQATGDDGVASVTFTPGAFATSEDATGTCTVTATATLNGTVVSRSVDLSWRNYPSFSVSVSASPSTVLIGNEANVTISLAGDGWEFGPAPMDVMMCISRAPTMLDGAPPAIGVVKNVAKDFSAMMDSGADSLGLVSYGCYLDEDVSLDLSLSSGFSTFNASINALSPEDTTNGKGPDKKSGLDLGIALGMAVDELVDHGTSDNKVIVAILDDEFTNGWNRDSWETSAKQKAIDNEVKIYVIILDMPKKNGNSNGNDHNGLEKKIEEMAEDTGAKILKIDGTNCNNYNSDLVAFFAVIKSDLKDATIFETTLDTSLVNVTVTNTTVTDLPVLGGNVLQYQYVDGVSTNIVNQTWVSTTVDDTLDWTDRVLDYDIGTMEYGQTWTANLRFALLQTGTIGLFTDGASKISFSNAAGTTYEQTLPPVYITVFDQETADIFGTSALSIPSLDALGDNNTLSIAVDWTLDYAGEHPESVRQRAQYQYSADNIVWNNLWHDFAVPAVDEDVTGDYSAELDTDKKNGYYRIRIHAWEAISGGAEAWRTTEQPVRIDDGKKIRMKLI